MDTKEILRYCIEKGVLIDSEALNLLKETADSTSAKLIIEKLRNHTQRRVITKTLFEENKEKISKLFLELPNESQKSLESLKIKLGLEIEISRVSSSPVKKEEVLDGNDEAQVKVLTETPNFNKKIDLQDFVINLKNRFTELRNILQDHRELENLVSINKLSKSQKSSIIGIIYEKRVTKNKNILLEVEDLTGRTRVLINQNKPELYAMAEDITLDSVLGFSGFGDNEIFFANNIVFPDAALFEKKNSPVEEYVAFISDLQFGSKLFLKDQFEKFIHYLSDDGPNDPEVKKIKYLFIVGDLISGVGVYPSQLNDLEIGDIEEQYIQISKLLKRVRKDIKIIISPGNHDGVRLQEPQPLMDEKFAWPLYKMENVILTGNPSIINIGARDDFPGFNILTYHGYSYPYYYNNIPSLINADAINSPEKIMKYVMKYRHLAPSYGSIQYVPYEKDELVIRDVPDIFVSGHLHKSGITSYNGILVIACSTWEAETENQKKRGNKPDFCKVPLMNLKTRAIKILDFE